MKKYEQFNLIEKIKHVFKTGPRPPRDQPLERKKWYGIKDKLTRNLETTMKFVKDILK
jgi:hypothetical protein